MSTTLSLAAVARTDAVLSRIAMLAPPRSAGGADASGCLRAMVEHERIFAELGGLLDELTALRTTVRDADDGAMLDRLVAPVVEAAQHALAQGADLALRRAALEAALAGAPMPWPGVRGGVVRHG